MKHEPREGRPLETMARMGYATLAVVLSIGMGFTIHELGASGEEQVQSLREEEALGTRVDRLRSSSELVVSLGRAYLLSGDAELLGRIAQAESDSSEQERALEQELSSAEARALAVHAREVAAEFVRTHHQLLAARRSSGDHVALTRRFETELRPLSRSLRSALLRLATYHEYELAQLYAKARADRLNLERRLYGLLALLVLGSIVLGFQFSRTLGRVDRSRREALGRARSALAARDELMGVVAHDLRNPLAAITMRAGLLRTLSDVGLMQRQADAIESVATRMEYLIKSILDLTTMEAGTFAIRPTCCSVSTLVQKTTEMFGALCAAKAISFEQRIEEPAPEVYADEERILQVLSNLLGNAIRFTPRGGTITLETCREATKIRFGVLDTGPGIAEANHERIFERFWKEEGQEKPGTGLGLFIAKSIIDAHGGRIWVEGSVGGGGRFYFTLPLIDR